MACCATRLDQPGPSGDRQPDGQPVTATAAPPSDIVDWLSTTDHKRIGILYIATAFGFFLVAGLMAELIRIQLAQPGQSVVSASVYDQLFTMHGTLMLLFFATPIGSGFAN